ncbi:MAG: quinolinate synthase NadA [Deltaproteobacteria bacterium]|nr:quinolinate synthase NadA [Deltaproteobacteria bacterium]
MIDKTLDNELIKKIIDIKQALGPELIILTHHYQRSSIVDLGDFKGDSFGLSKTAAEDGDARYIVFCGVHFMAESAAILAKSHQTVQIPDMEAGCWMADMADHSLVEYAWQQVSEIIGEKAITPLVYMNSDAKIKAFCGRNSGAVCTSSNAPDAFKWAFSRREKIFFFPDRYLGINTANKLSIPPDLVIVWRPGKPLGGNTESRIRKSRVIVWDGYCLVHTRFTVDHIRGMRNTHPDAAIVVHPECTPEVIAAADADGSTKFIVNYVKNAAPGSTIAIGTEINLIERLAEQYPDKTVLPLYRSLCPNMYKITPEKLLLTLTRIGEYNRISIETDIKKDARLALDRMLRLTEA